jgi:agmatinase
VRPLLTFMGAPFADDLGALAADLAFLGAPYGSPYDMRGVAPPAAEGPDAVRRLLHELELDECFDHWDVDCDCPVLPDGTRLVDCGDVAGDPRDLEGTKRRTTETVRAIVGADAIPLIVGGDDAIPPIVCTAFSDLEGGIHVLHIDAHIDFRDSLRGVSDGYSSPIRRLREMPFVGDIVQVGIRGIGSARKAEWDAAQEAGNRIVPATELHALGAEAVFAKLPTDRRWFVTIDCDGLDPSVAPGVTYPEPGGVTYGEAAVFIRGLARAQRLVGVEFTEFVPALDVRSLTALAVGRLLMNVVSLTRPTRGAVPTG